MFSTLSKTSRCLCIWHYSRNSPLYKRSHNTGKNETFKKNARSTVYYLSSIGVLTVGLSYAAVPLYKMFCQVSAALIHCVCITISHVIFVFQAFSYGGTLNHNVQDSKVETMKPIRNREIKVHFTADTSSSMQWSFKPLQTEIRVLIHIFSNKFHPNFQFIIKVMVLKLFI